MQPGRFLWIPLLLLVTGCTPSIPGLIAPGKPAPELSAREWVGGEPPSVGGKIVVVDVFATWCQPCAKVTPQLVEVYNEFHPRGVEFVAITSEDESSLADVKAFRDAYEVPWPVGVGAEETIDQMGVQYIPMVIVIGADGNILSIGDDEARLRSTLAKALAAGGV